MASLVVGRLLALAVAKECGLNFVSVKYPEILNRYIWPARNLYVYRFRIGIDF
jgi:hypothetical protein